MGVHKEVWTAQIMEGYYTDSNFLNYVTDFSDSVNNSVLHMTKAGLDPQVLENNTTYPIEIGERQDNDIAITLSRFETKNTVIRQTDAIQVNYNKLESVIRGHRNSLRNTTAIKAAHAYSPNSNTAETPVILTTGATDLEGNKRLTIADVLKFKRLYDNLDIPLEKRYLILNPQHLEDLILEDSKTFANITDIRNGTLGRFVGFNILQFTKTAYYNVNTLQKLALNGTVTPEHNFSSFAFFSEEVMKCDGELDMFIRENDPEHRGDIIGFNKRFIALPIRNFGIGAIVTAKA